MAASKDNADIPTRVTVLEHGLGELKTTVSAGFTSLQTSIDRLIDKGAGQRTNWYLVAGFVVAVVTLIGSMVTVAEWRIGQAVSPFHAIPEQVQQLRVDIERREAAAKAVEEYKRLVARGEK